MKVRPGVAVALAAALLAAGCAVPPPAPGSSETEVVSRLGAPTARYALDGGATRLEYAGGPWGRWTWMVDVDAGGRVTAATQVLGEAQFLALQQRGAVTADEVLRAIGTPGERRHAGRLGGERWSWRYPTNDCLWFQVEIGDDGRVRGSGYGIDPSCDAPSDRN